MVGEYLLNKCPNIDYNKDSTQNKIYCMIVKAILFLWNDGWRVHYVKSKFRMERFY